MQSHHLTDKSVTKLARAVRLAIGLMSAVLPLLYAWLSFRSLSLSQVIDTISNSTTLDVLWKIVITIYYTGWVIGSTNDTNFHEDVAVRAPFAGKLPLEAIGLLCVFLLVAVLLLYAHTYEQFVTLIAIFFGLNVVGYLYIVKTFTIPMVEESRRAFAAASDHYALERLEIFTHYQMGRWQLWRFLLGVLIIAGMIVIALHKLNYGGTLPYVGDVPIEVIQVVSMAFFVVVLEVWISYMRLRTIAQLAAIDRIAQRYELKPRNP
jgi:hypothetical protein